MPSSIYPIVGVLFLPIAIEQLHNYYRRKK
jgi:hypothetical protein